MPEIMLAVLAMSMQIFGIFSRASSRKVTTWTVIFGLGIVLYLLYFTPDYEIDFNQSFVTSPVISLFKAIVLALTLMSLLIYKDLTKIKNKKLKQESWLPLLFL